MIKLVKYDAACRAIAAASRVDEVKSILDMAIAMKLYAKLANDEQMERDAVVIRSRSERRLGVLMEKQAKTIGTAKGNQHTRPLGVSKTPSAPPSLAEAGIDKNLAKRARKAAAVPEKQFDELLEDLRTPTPKPPKPDRPREKRRASQTYDAPSSNDIFRLNAEHAIELADRNYDDVAVDEGILTLARHTVEAWIRCVRRLETTVRSEGVTNLERKAT